MGIFLFLAYYRGERVANEHTVFKGSREVTNRFRKGGNVGSHPSLSEFNCTFRLKFTFTKGLGSFM